jgi:deoxyribose-phosphate aldolase
MDILNDVLAQAWQFVEELPPAPARFALPKGREIARWIDHTLLKPDATARQVQQLCQEAREYEFASVCVNPAYVPLAAGLLSGSPVEVCAVVGFPLGATLSTQKVFEALSSISHGATEVDMVQNIGALKSEAYGMVFNDILAVVDVAHNARAIVKVIIEAALLTREEKILASLIAKAAGADFVKTSTGFASAGATCEDVELMRRVVGENVGVKAAGGIRTYQDALDMIRAGANRLGASAGVKIVKEAES